MSSRRAKESAVKAAMSIATDVTEGRLDPDVLGAQALDECRTLFGRVAGPGDPLWPLHVDVARQVLALGSAGGGIPAHELAEWAAVEKRAEDERAEGVPTGED
ncbi:hypothetical protein A5735_05015 [Mycolicibacter heraklionensis]|nr:hypothetical protein A5735_05015 [Mycolicibacter heraklionensis]